LIEIDHHVEPKESFGYAAKISKPYGVLDKMINWCKLEMQDPSWRWQMIHPSNPGYPGTYIFYFNNERDYFSFLLKWR
jgi:hypothetical protein